MLLSKIRKVLFLVFTFSIILTGQNFVFAEDQYSESLVPILTGPDSHPPIKISSSVEKYGPLEPWNAFDGVWDQSGWYTLNNPRPAGGHYLKIDFGEGNEKQVEKINVSSWSMPSSKVSVLKDWELYGSNDDVTWTKITTGTYPNLTVDSFKTVPYTFSNDSSYRYYRFNAISSYAPPDYGGSATVGLTELELMEKVKSNPDPDPNPNPDPNPDPNPNPNPTGNALLVIYMDSGLIKEFEMTNEEIRNFTEWYEDRAKGNGREAYIVNKKYNIGPFNSRKDFISYSHIESFEVQEYSR
ncbi:discoidin domain-containing protein [Brevibacillus laterosporus]|uniref:discoidin domain-containing protein n=2 Tax=Brevibacillus laterosporus TaxID=1465 RepID=UPI00215D170F|nr:discoidin domain-containing protein [Brevibacillus laterosporus]MCR8936345.1 discoidin domain-containing protein [Brevibacillus laterosporus]MCZ0838984.1 discoidin domain-containing protein [Brevibacillus laterosporus]